MVDSEVSKMYSSAMDSYVRFGLLPQRNRPHSSVNVVLSCFGCQVDDVANSHYPLFLDYLSREICLTVRLMLCCHDLAVSLMMLQIVVVLSFWIISTEKSALQLG